MRWSFLRSKFSACWLRVALVSVDAEPRKAVLRPVVLALVVNRCSIECEQPAQSFDAAFECGGTSLNPHDDELGSKSSDADERHVRALFVGFFGGLRDVFERLSCERLSTRLQRREQRDVSLEKSDLESRELIRATRG